VAINPFTLGVTVSGLAIDEKGGGPFISIGEVHTRLSVASIYKRALVLSEVSVHNPAITLVRHAPNRYSFSDITDRLTAQPKKESSGDFRFSINNISIAGGSIDVDDRAVAGGVKHTLRNLEVSVPFISNISYLRERYIDPHVSAVVDGAPFNFSGKLKPLSKSMETAVRIDLKQLDLPRFAAYLPFKPPANLTSGKLTTETEISYRVFDDKKPRLGIRGLVRLDGVAVDQTNGAPLARLPLFQIRATELELFSRRFLFDSVIIDGLELFVSRDKKGEWMYHRLMAALPAEKKGEQAHQETKPPQGGIESLLQVASFSFKNGVVHLSDALPQGGFRGDATQIDLSITNLSTASKNRATYDLSLLLDNRATLAIDGTFSLAPLAVTASAELSDLQLQRGWPYLARFLTSPVKGSVGLSADVRYDTENGLVVEQGALQARGLSARYGDMEGMDLARLEVTGVGYRQKKNRIDVAALTLSRGNISVSRETDGSISILSLLKKENGASPPPPEKKPGPAGTRGASGDIAYSVRQIRIDQLQAAFTDKTVPDKPRFTLRNTSLSLTGLNGPLFTPATLRFSSTFNKATTLSANGTLTPSPFRYRGRIEVGRLPLRDFDPYFPANLNVFLVNGSFDTGMTVDIALKDGKLTGTYKGNAGISGFHLIDTVAEEDLLMWESLQLDDIRGSLDPFMLALRQIALSGVYSRIIVRKDGTLNLQNLVEKPPAETGTALSLPAPPPAAGVSSSPAAAAAASTAATPPPKKQIQIDSITVQGGTLAFTDNHLPRTFSTTFYNLGGRVSGLNSEESTSADVDLRGNLENHSPLRITGRINPLRDDLFVDLKVSFRDIELSPVTPYSGTYLGYTVEKGKLYLDLTYRIDKKQLDASNNIFIDQFTFGQRVESDKATKLPVKLGLALLKDRNGEIHLDVPVTGRTDDPKFSIWRLVFQVLKNLMVKAVTSPFSLLSSLFGGGHDFSSVQFAAGTSALSPQEEVKLDALARILLDRPALKVELKGYVDREKDSEGYRRELLDRKLRNEKFLALGRERKLTVGETVDTVRVMPEEYPKYLSAVYKKEKFPKPRNIIGMVKDLPLDEMRKLIIAITVVGEPELQSLARERVTAVMNYLVAKKAVPAGRIFQKNDDLFKAPDKESGGRSRVELNAIAQ
jgi:hypothetical protein